LPERYLGRTLGRFRIDGLCGSGGFAWVYKAYDPDLEVYVALKVLKPQYAGDEKFESRFRREAATAARLRHPNIVKIFAVGKDGDAVYFAMDYLPNGLPERLAALETLPEPVLVRLGIDVASALGFAHREGVIHRDIKVDNILFDDHGNAVVADFGIARAVSNYVQQTGTNMVVGTPQYFSPEQARGQNLDGRADIYSLGVTLYKAATGVLPFNGEDWYEIARQHVEDRPARPRTKNLGLSRGMERVILTCLEKDPANRFQTGELLAQELATLLHEQGRPVATGSPRHTIVAMQGARSASGTPTTVPDLPTAPIVPPWARARTRRRYAQWTTALAVLALLLYVAAARRHSGVAARPVRAADPTVALAAAPATDSAGAPGVAARRSGTSSAPPPQPAAGAPPGTGTGGAASETAVRPTLRISAPGGSRVLVNGMAVPAPEWRSDTLAPGRYEVAAAVPGLPGCPVTHESTVATVASHGTTDVHFASRGCGTVLLDALPSGASYAFRALSSGDEVTAGRAPAQAPITLPSGEYSVEVSAQDCATYRDTVHMAAATPAPRRLRVRLVCGT